MAKKDEEIVLLRKREEEVNAKAEQLQKVKHVATIFELGRLIVVCVWQELAEVLAKAPPAAAADSEALAAGLREQVEALEREKAIMAAELSSATRKSAFSLSHRAASR